MPLFESISFIHGFIKKANYQVSSEKLFEKVHTSDLTFLAERQWDTMREDYSPGGNAWEYFPHDHQTPPSRTDSMCADEINLRIEIILTSQKS